MRCCALLYACCQGKPHYLPFRQSWTLTHLWYVHQTFAQHLHIFAPRVSNTCNSFPPTLLTKLAGMSLTWSCHNYKNVVLSLKLMFRLRACTEDIANFALFAEAFAANSYKWMFWLELRRRNKQSLNSGDEFPNTC